MQSLTITTRVESVFVVFYYKNKTTPCSVYFARVAEHNLERPSKRAPKGNTQTQNSLHWKHTKQTYCVRFLL